jgi:hypothetical protein
VLLHRALARWRITSIPKIERVICAPSSFFVYLCLPEPLKRAGIALNAFDPSLMPRHYLPVIGAAALAIRIATGCRIDNG